METLEQAMSRIAVAINGEVEIEIVNAGQEGAEFFKCELREFKWSWAAALKRGVAPVCYGFGTGNTALEAVLKAEQVMDDLGKRPQCQGQDHG